jgi:hypothetical protein
VSLIFDLNVDASQATASINKFFNAFEQGAAQATTKLAKSLGEPIQKEIQVRLEGGELVGKEVAKLGKNTQDVVAGTKALKGEYGKTANALKQQEQALQRVLGNTQKWLTGTKRINPEYQQLTQTLKAINKEQQKLGSGSAFNNLFTKFVGVQTAANLVTGAIQKVGQSIVNMAQTGFEMETLTLQLEAFTGSAEAADAAFKEFGRIAAQTPFDLQQVANAGRIMMAFGIEADVAIEATEQLAVVAAATGGDLQLLARNMGQIVAQGRAYTRDLTQFAIQGVPIWEQLSVVTGESVAALKNLAKEGKIGGAEVTAALELMTQEGTAFFEIAQRMQETFQGRFARIESSVQQLAKAFVDTFNAIDRALGLIVSGQMKLLADVILVVAENLTQITSAAIAAAGAIGAFFLIQNWGAVVAGVKAFNAAMVLQTIVTRGAAAAQATLAFLTGNWIAVAGAVAAGAAIYQGLSYAIDESAKSAVELEREARGGADAVGELSGAEERLASRDKGDLVDKYKQARKEADGIKKELDAAVEKVKRQKEAIEERYNREIELSKEVQAEQQYLLDTANYEYKRLKDNITDAYQPQIDALERSLDLARQKNQEEIDLLRARTPEEQKLLDFEKEKLKAKLAKGGLEKEEQLRLEARLSRMNQQEKIEAKQAENKKEEKKIEDKITKLKDDQRTALEALDTKYKDYIKGIEQGLEDEKQKVRELEKQRDDATKPLQDAIESSEDIGIATDTSTIAVNKQVTAVNNLAAKWGEATTAANQYAAAARGAKAAENSGGGGNNNKRRGTAFRFAGGPVTGGANYTVNEFGQEAFLSAAGKLSMIDAPSWGNWKAPGSGTVIPAHLTKQLNIPAGGTSVNRAAASQVNRAGASGGDMMRALRGLNGGSSDRITNNVTIQAANTTQAASDMMVQLNKIRRRRMG